MRPVLVQDLCTDSCPVGTEKELIGFLRRRFGGANRFVLWGQGEEWLPCLWVYVRGGIAAAYFITQDNVMYASKGQEWRADWEEFCDAVAPEGGETVELAGSSVVSWADARQRLLEFARTGSLPAAAWERL